MASKKVRTFYEQPQAAKLKPYPNQVGGGRTSSPSATTHVVEEVTSGIDVSTAIVGTAIYVVVAGLVVFGLTLNIAYPTNLLFIFPALVLFGLAPLAGLIWLGLAIFNWHADREESRSTSRADRAPLGAASASNSSVAERGVGDTTSEGSDFEVFQPQQDTALGFKPLGRGDIGYISDQAGDDQSTWQVAQHQVLSASPPPTKPLPHGMRLVRGRQGWQDD